MADPVTLADFIGLYEKEYLLLVKTYEDYNNQSLLIKGWSVTVGMASILAAYLAKPPDRPGRLAVLIAACSVLPFLALDTLWKALQHGYLLRIGEIEEVFRQIADNPKIGLGDLAGAPLQGFETWATGFDKVSLSGYLKAFWNSTVLLPHILIIGFGILLAWRFPPKPAQQTAQGNLS
ncbi:MAG: hypothetical protein AB3N21_16535 [Ruegeria sp.]|uniref:hypothetical protein n=1 Tax=Ruegeria sp. TaxID=1879320 RepID=UPI00349E6259